MSITFDLRPERAYSYITGWAFPLSSELQAPSCRGRIWSAKLPHGRVAQRLASCSQAGSWREGPRRCCIEGTQLLLPNASIRSVTLPMRGATCPCCPLWRTEWRCPLDENMGSNFPQHIIIIICYALSKLHHSRNSGGPTRGCQCLLNNLRKRGKTLPFYTSTPTLTPPPHLLFLTI